MIRYFLLVALCASTGCQTTQTTVAGPRVATEPFSRIEQLSIFVENYLDTYDLVVQRAALEKDAAGNGDWAIVGAPRVTGYAERWLAKLSDQELSGYASKSLYLLNGEVVELTVRPGIQLMAKVIPQKGNLIRVVGIYSQAEVTALGLEEFTLPFDTECATGSRIVFYRKEYYRGSSATP